MHPESTIELVAQRFVAALACLAALASPERAHACSQSAPVRHSVAIGADGSVRALADPREGHVIVVDGSAAHTAMTAPDLENQVAAFTSDGHTMVVAREDWSDENRGAGCLATFVFVERIDLRTGARTRIRRLRSGGASAAKISPNDRWLILEALDYSGEPVVHLFDLETGERVRVTRDLHGDFLDDDTLLLENAEFELRVVARADNRLVATLPPRREGESFSYVPGGRSSTSFLLEVRSTHEPTRLLTVERDERRVRVRRSRRPLRGGRAVQTSADGSRVLVLGDGRATILDSTTLREVARVSGAPRYTTAALSADGNLLALVSIRHLTPEEGEDVYDMSATLPTTVERIDLRTGARSASGSGPTSTLEQRHQRTETAPR